jgi:uncharacterized RDD family membrane protein YckC
LTAGETTVSTILPAGARAPAKRAQGWVGSDLMLVAKAESRLAAAFWDASLVSAALAVFALIIAACGLDPVLRHTPAPAWIVLLILFWAIYQIFWCMAGLDTPGTRAAGLQLLTYRGNRADSGIRIRRILGAALMGAGIVPLAAACLRSPSVCALDVWTRTYFSPLRGPLLR